MLLMPLVPHTIMSDTIAWEEYCKASLDLSDQDDIGISDIHKELDEIAAENQRLGLYDLEG